MVMTQIANQPIMFGSDSIIRYGENVAGVYQEKIIVETANTPIAFTNSQGTAQYTQSGTGTAGLQPFTSN